MQKRLQKRALVTLTVLTLLIGCMSQTAGAINAGDFKNPPAGVKLHAWWHWMDGAITKEGITKDLEAMAQQGISQATILNIGLFDGRDFGVPQIKFNSPEWYEMFRWALAEANRLGIAIGAHNCDGWSSSGGPWITPETSMKQYVWSNMIVEGGRQLTIKLPRPYSERDFYRDVAVVAYPSGQPSSSFQSAIPKVAVNGAETVWLTDGNPISGVAVRRGDKIQLAFDEPFTAEKIVIHPRKRFAWGRIDSFMSRCTLSVSQDGKGFEKVKNIEIRGLNRSVSIEIPATSAKFYQLEVTDYSDMDSYIPFMAAEVELLKKNEEPLYQPAIPYHLAKTVSVKVDSRRCFDTFAGPAADKTAVSQEQVVDITDKMSADGTLKWDAPPGDWRIIRFGFTSTGAENGPATGEGRGLECDKMDARAVDLHFRSYPQKLADAAGEYAGNTFKFLLIDSWECGYQTWTESFPAEFEKRRGYSIINWIPVLCGETLGGSALSEAFLYDFRKTIAELIEQNYYKHFSKLCHKAKIEMHAEVIYGGPSYPPLDILKSNSYADLPMFEFWAGHSRETSLPNYTPVAKPEAMFPANACVCYDMPVLGAEAYTAQAHYSESPYDLKPFGDRAYCSGVNQFILHSYVHQPFDKKPGMTLSQWASHFNRNNLYWQHISDWFAYHARVQYVLQQGAAVSQVLHFVGDQLPQGLDQSELYSLPVGYTATACNLDVLKDKVKLADGKLQMTNRLSFSLLSIPDSSAMEPDTLQRIAELANDGAVVYGPKPARVLSLSNLTENEKALQELANKIWGKIDGKQVTENEYGKGKVIWGKPLAQVLDEMKVLPALETNGGDSPGFLYIHKKTDDADVFFVANQLNTELRRECLFNTANNTPEIWDAEQGTVVKPAIYNQENGRIRLPVTFKPRQSLLFIFKDGQARDHITSVAINDKKIFPQPSPDSPYPVPHAVFDKDAITLTAEKSGTYTLGTSDNKTFTVKLDPPEITVIDNFKGTIDFVPGGYEADIKPVETTELKSWTDFDDPAIKYFSGTAAYTIRFTVPAGFTSGPDSLMLSLGQIGSTANVSLNGKHLAYVFRPNAMLDVTGLLTDGQNVLKAEVANVYRNRIIGDYIESGEVRTVWTSAPVQQYLDKTKPLKPSGIIGPIQLLRITNKQIPSMRN